MAFRFLNIVCFAKADKRLFWLGGSFSFGLAQDFFPHF
jgi:hypothetical protein